MKKPTLVQSHTVWFEDGNLDIVAGDTVFRVHRSVVVQHSSLLTGAATRTVQDIAEPCGKPSRVHVPDHKIAMEHFLQALFVPS